jgi:hypothetical protein
MVEGLFNESEAHWADARQLERLKKRGADSATPRWSALFGSLLTSEEKSAVSVIP